MITVFSKEWFAKYNKQLCWLANSFIGQFVFNFRKFGHYPENKIVRITPNSIDEFVGYKGNKLELKAHFFGRNEYALRLQKVFYPIWILAHTWDMLIANNFVPQLNLGFDTLEVYPAAGANSPVDGLVQHNVAENTWATIRDGAGTGVGVTQAELWFGRIGSGATTDKWTNIMRAIFLFDASAIDDDATISEAVLSLYGTDKSNTLSSSPTLNIYTSSPANDNNLVAADYTQVGTTAQCDTAIAYADFNAAGYNAFTFNATGIGNVSKIGLSRFGSREVVYDVGNTPPPWVASSLTYFQGYFADSATNKPKLVVTYSIPAPAQAGFLFLMV